jgi:hypothetical protein
VTDNDDFDEQKSKRVAAVLRKNLPGALEVMDATFLGDHGFLTDADTSNETVQLLLQRYAECTATWFSVKTETLRVLAAADAGMEEVDPGLFRVNEPYQDSSDPDARWVPGMIWGQRLMPTWLALLHAQQRVAELGSDWSSVMLGIWAVGHPDLADDVVWDDTDNDKDA